MFYNVLAPVKPPLYEVHTHPSLGDFIKLRGEVQYVLDIASVYERLLLASERISLDAIRQSLEGIEDTALLYCVNYEGVMVYLGAAQKKTRLLEHWRKLTEATLIRNDEVTFQFVPCEWRLALLSENALIEHHRPEWNRNGGFGRRPGDDSREDKPNKWGQKYGYSGYKEKNQSAQMSIGFV